MAELKYNVIGLCNVPELTSEQELNILFKSKQDQKDFFDSRLVSLTNEDGTTWTGEDISFLRDYQPIKVPFGLDELINVNYLYCINYPANYPIRYYFINSKEYINDNCTRLNIELDVIQTYQFYVEDRECFIEQAHEKRYRIENQGNRQVIRFNVDSTERQGLNYGEKYIVSNQQDIITTVDQFDRVTGLKFYYIFTNGEYTTGAKAALGTTDEGIPSGLTVYLGVGYDTEKPIIAGGVSPSPQFTTYEMTNFNKVDYNYWLKNPNIYQVLVSYIPPVNVSVDETFDDITINFGSHTSGDITHELDFVGQMVTKKVLNDSSINTTFNLVQIEKRFLSKSLYNYPAKRFHLPEFYHPQNIEDISDRYDEITEDPYLNMYPYTYSVLYYNGNSIEIHHELCEIQDVVEASFETDIHMDVPVVDMRQFISLASQGGSAVELHNYPFSSVMPDINYEYLLTMPTSASLDVINDTYINYMLQNKNQRQAGYDAANLQLGLGAASSAFGVASSLVTGNPIGAIAGVGGLAGTIASSQMRVKQMQAQEQDIKNTPNDVRVGAGDISYLLNSKLISPKLTTYTIKNEYKVKIHNYFHRFGRRINKLASVKNMINTRKYFNYIKTVDYVAKGEKIDQDSLMKIQGILNRGITFWHYNKNDVISHDIGNYNVNNCENMEATV